MSRLARLVPSSALRIAALALGAMLLFPAASVAQAPAERLTLQDLQPGTTPERHAGCACLPQLCLRQQRRTAAASIVGLGGLLKLCAADENGLHEVYFEYDNEAEYILRALNDPERCDISEPPSRLSRSSRRRFLR